MVTDLEECPYSIGTCDSLYKACELCFHISFAQISKGDLCENYRPKILLN